MSSCKSNLRRATVLLLASVLLTTFAYAQSPAKQAPDKAALAAEKAQMEALGHKYKTATELFEALRAQGCATEFVTPADLRRIAGQ